MRLLLVPMLALMTAAVLRAQSIPAPGEITQAAASAPPAAADDDVSSTPPTPAPRHTGHGSSAATDLAMEHLTRSNQELLDLLKKQQAVLEDIQYDRRLQERQITLLEQRLEDTLQLNAALQSQVARLQGAASAARAAAVPADQAPTTSGPSPSNADASAAQAVPAPAPPASALPPEESGGAPGTMWWHRVLSLSGTDSQNSDLFHVSSKQWRVLWHNQDRAGAAYKNTSALFISALPKHDTMPKKVCSQLGTGGDLKEMTGSGDYYLKIESSGGKWELAVEDFR